MKFHGLVLLTVIGVTHSAFGQNRSGSSPETFLPPAQNRRDDATGAPSPLPHSSDAVDPNSSTDIQAEMQKFRSELREFQAIREDVTRSTKSAEADSERVSMLQRQELLDLLTKLAKRPPVRRPSNSPSAPVEPIPDTTIVVRPVPPVEPPQSAKVPVEMSPAEMPANIADAFALGKVLFRTRDYVGAERAFRKASVTSENEMALKYLLATCLRHQSKTKSALDAYKVVAESNQDPVLRDMAKWQIDNILWIQQSEAQLQQMRKIHENQAEVTNGSSANLGDSKR